LVAILSSFTTFQPTPTFPSTSQLLLFTTAIMLSNTILALSLLPVSFAHFTLNWPASRGSAEDTAGNFPCGGYNDVQQQRTDFPMSGAPIQLNMGHEQTNVAVYMAVGSNPGSGFSVVVRPQFVVTGLGDFCMGQISVPSGVNVSDGTPASIQVVSNAHTSGGLYQARFNSLQIRTSSTENFKVGI
jgi:nascent polypeptide-associated complex subunit beta